LVCGFTRQSDARVLTYDDVTSTMERLLFGAKDIAVRALFVTEAGRSTTPRQKQPIDVLHAGAAVPRSAWARDKRVPDAEMGGSVQWKISF